MVVSSLDTVVLQSTSGGSEVVLILLVLMFFLLFAILPMVGVWKTFQKAGKPGWAAIVPVYNIWLMIDIADREWWWLIVIFFIGLALIIPLIDLAEKFDKGAGYGLGLYFLPFVFWPMLGLGDAQYQS
jgi:hypothetical protein